MEQFVPGKPNIVPEKAFLDQPGIPDGSQQQMCQPAHSIVSSECPILLPSPQLRLDSGVQGFQLRQGLLVLPC